MSKIHTLLLTILMLPMVHAFELNSNITSENFCEDNLKERLATRENRMAFTNRGGLQNGGVCWWHSRFQRNALFLTYFSPEKERPQDRWVVRSRRFRRDVKVPAPGSIRDIIGKIRYGNQIIEIPGYRNFYEFSAANYSLIQAELERWQKSDGFFRFRWVSGLRGAYNVTPESMKNIMDSTYDRFMNGEILYQKLQIQGITSHSWLIQDMEPTPYGYKLMVVDSNFLSLQVYHYREGDTSFHHPHYGQFVPYTGNRGELNKLENIRSGFCQ